MEYCAALLAQLVSLVFLLLHTYLNSTPMKVAVLTAMLIHYQHS